MPVVSDYTAVLSGHSLHGSSGKSVFFTYSFPVAVPEYYYSAYSAEALATFRPYTESEKNAARQALWAFQSISGIAFFEVAPDEGDIRFSAYEFDILMPEFAGFAYYPSGIYDDQLSSDIFMDYSYAAHTHTLLHEIGHALGLKHTFEGHVTLSEHLDHYGSSVMSYTSGGRPGDVLGPLDVQAIQYLYAGSGGDGTHVSSWSWNAASRTLTQSGFGTADELLGVGSADVIFGYAGDDYLLGREGNDRLDGGDGADQLYGGVGADTLLGGLGVDYLQAGDGDDRLEGGDGADQLIGGDGADTLLGDLGADNLYAGYGDDRLEGGGDGDFLYGDDGNDRLEGGAGEDTLHGQQGNDVLFGGTERDSLYGGIDNDELRGEAGDDTIFGGEGRDTFLGGEGDDLLYDEFEGTTPSFQADGGNGVDLFGIQVPWRPAVSFVSLSDAFAAGAVLAGVESIAVFGNDNGNHIVGSDRAEYLSGGAIADRLAGGGGADTLLGDGGDDELIGGAGADSLNGGEGADRFTYLSLADSTDAAMDVIGSFQSGADRIDLSALGSGTVAWSVSPGSNYRIVTVTAGGATMKFQVEGPVAAADFLLAAPVISGTAGNDVLIGSSASETLDGGQGSDRMEGRGGDDTYIVDNAGDQAIESAGQGTDIVYSSVSYGLTDASEVETLSTIAWEATTPLNLTGNSRANSLIGNAGANQLDGKAGADVMTGRAGNDKYFVDNAGDRAVESAGQGIDIVYSAVSYALGSEVESLSAITWELTTPLNLTGNSLANTLIGNAGANLLHGGGGNDVMIGREGDDSYLVDSAGDRPTEAAGQGTDIVYSALSYTLGASSNIENLAAISFAATTALNLTGNGVANTLLGNDGANQLDGKAGADTMVGRAGNDKYLIDNAGDWAIEAAGGGSDVVYSAVSFTLTDAQEIEGLSAITWEATNPINLTGNSLRNNLIGNAGVNILDGKAGNDTLQGREGADTYAFTSALGAANIDLILGFSAADDTIRLENSGVFTGLANGALPAAAFVIGTAAKDADDRIIYDPATGRLFFDADGSGAGAQIQFATLQGAPAITANDFTVI